MVGSLGDLYIEPIFALQYHPPSMGIDYYGRRIAGFASGDTQVSWVLLFAFCNPSTIWFGYANSRKIDPKRHPEVLKNPTEHWK